MPRTSTARVWRRLSIALPWLALATGASGQDAARVYEQYATAVAKVELVEARSGAPSAVGTAFFVAPSLLLTNYHVVQELLFRPRAYALRLVPTDGVDAGAVRIVAIDPANDLAVLRVDRVHGSPLSLAPDSIPTGEVLYSIGHPADLRTAVVEGTYNGAVDAAAAALVHFSGSINPGMSGGPTVRATGEVVGINVSTAGNQLSFLIPARVARALLADLPTEEAPDLDAVKREGTRRLLAFQDAFFAPLVAAPLPTTRIGSASLPAGPDAAFDCSAEPHDLEDEPYEMIEYVCFTQDDMLLGPGGGYDLIYMEHMYLASETLNPVAFNALVSEWHSAVLEWEVPVNDDATRYRCERRTLDEGLAAQMVVIFCARAHLSHPGLLDLFVRSTLRGGNGEAVVSTLRSAAISWDNARGLTRRWLEGFQWMP